LEHRAKVSAVTAREIALSSDGNTFVFDRGDGSLKEARIGGEKFRFYLHPQIMRATIDNDVQNIKKWAQFGLDRAKAVALSDSFDDTKDGLAFYGAFLADSYRPQVNYSIRYRVKGAELEVTLSGEGSDKIEFLPRFGITFFLPQTYGDYTYCGYGEGESYLDKHVSTRKDIFRARVKEDYVRYIRPQESTSHCGSSWLEISDGANAVSVTADREFSFSVTPYTVAEIMAAAHDEELPESERTVVSLDYKMSGVGSESCGPHLDKQYQLNEKQFQIVFRITFNKKGNERINRREHEQTDT
jgi:beta-galactosidase